jgi:hypothetical protein
MGFFDLERLKEPTLASLVSTYRLAEPFPHIVLEDFVVASPEEVVSAFPDADWEGWTDRSHQFQPGKWSCRDIAAMPPLLMGMIHELSDPPFLRVLTELTAIEKLLPDPFLEGGGLQWTQAGGKLSPHTDFHNHPTLPLYRRMNALVFLNPDWKPSDGGELCMFNMGDEWPVVVVPPRYGTCVIFTTDHRSVHGVRPISSTAGRRRSIALYYYTVEPPEVFSGDRNTYWYEPTATPLPTRAERVRLGAMKAALNGSKLLAKIAYRVDPQHPTKA